MLISIILLIYHKKTLLSYNKSIKKKKIQHLKMHSPGQTSKDVALTALLYSLQPFPSPFLLCFFFTLFSPILKPFNFLSSSPFVTSLALSVILSNSSIPLLYLLLLLPYHDPPPPPLPWFSASSFTLILRLLLLPHLDPPSPPLPWSFVYSLFHYSIHKFKHWLTLIHHLSKKAYMTFVLV